MGIKILFGKVNLPIHLFHIVSDKNQYLVIPVHHDICFWQCRPQPYLSHILGLLFLDSLANVSGADADNIAYTCDYLKWIFLGAPFIMLANGFVHLFRPHR